MEGRQVLLVVGKPDDIQSCLGCSTHRKNIAETIGRSDLSEKVRIVNKRREEIQRHQHEQVVAQPVNTGIAEPFGPDQQVRIVKLRQTAHDLRSPLLGQLAGSAGATGPIHQPLLTSEQWHGISAIAEKSVVQ